MGRKYKYMDLENFLKVDNRDTIKMTFSDIEKLSGPLLESAYKYPEACWNNGGHNSFSRSWYNAGYNAAVNILDKSVIFTKKSNVDFTRKKIIKNNIMQHKVNIELSSIIISLRKYHYDTIKDETSRYHSWISCYGNFQKYWNDKSKNDYLALQLAWYLASWGMLRNSFLFEHDYQIHKNIINQLCSVDFENLFLYPEKQNTELVMKASNIIKKGYGDNSVTDTLATKILLGVFGCAPAFDRYFKESVKKYDVCGGNFNKETLNHLWKFYDENIDTFKPLQDEFLKSGVYYPPMKLLDMCFWQLGIIEE